jgi:hypothetical protein
VSLRGGRKQSVAAENIFLSNPNVLPATVRDCAHLRERKRALSFRLLRTPTRDFHV